MYCPIGCPVEHKVCRECDNRLPYRCRKDEGLKWPWCVVNVTKYNTDSRYGWEHCTLECVSKQTNAGKYNIDHLCYSSCTKHYLYQSISKL